MSPVPRILTDIKTWIIILFIIRLYGITNPPVEATHSWRQCLTNMQARNFLEVDNTILFPRIDMHGEKDGVIAGEFPLFNYLIYLWSLLFGYSHWAGRLINLIVSSIGIWYYYKLIEYFFKKNIAFYSSLFLLCSLWFSFSRKVMPDTFSVSLVIIGIYYGMIYLYKQNDWKVLAGYVLFCSAGALSKIPAMALMSVFVIPVFAKQIDIKQIIAFLLASLLILIPIACWYLVWVDKLLEQYGYQLYFYDYSLKEGFRQLVHDNGLKTLSVFYFNAFCGFFASALFLAGTYYFISKRSIPLILISLCVLPFLLLFMLKTGEVFSTHNYYVIPFIPFMALLAGYAVSNVKSEKIVFVILAIACIEGVLNQQHDFRKEQRDGYKLNLENIADKVCGRKDLVIVNGEGSPQLLYFMHRKGWNLNESDVFNKQITDSIFRRGAAFMFIDKKEVNSDLSKIDYNLVYEDENFNVFKLGEDGKN